MEPIPQRRGICSIGPWNLFNRSVELIPRRRGIDSMVPWNYGSTLQVLFHGASELIPNCYVWDWFHNVVESIPQHCAINPDKTLDIIVDTWVRSIWTHGACLVHVFLIGPHARIYNLLCNPCAEYHYFQLFHAYSYWYNYHNVSIYYFHSHYLT